MASGRKTSIVWNHFVSEDSKKGKCNYCSELISFTSGSLGNLSRHLKRKHPTISTAPVERQVLMDDEAESVHPRTETDRSISVHSNSTITVPPTSSIRPVAAQKSSAQPTMDGFTQKPLPPNKKSKIDQQLITMIAKEYQPLNIVNDTEFKKFVALLNPSYSLPTRKTLSESLLPRQYLQLKNQVKNEISKAQAVCITTDGWTSDNNESFIGVTAHYIDPEAGKMCANLLGCIEFDDSHTSMNLCHFLKNELREWQIENKVGVIVSDNAANIVAAVQLGGWRSVGCFAHSLNLIVQTGIGTMSDELTKVKRIVEYFQRSTTGLNKLKSIQKQMNTAELKLKQDVSTRWNSTYDMLDRVVKIKEALIATLAIVRSDLILSTEDWTLIEMALPILKIFYEVTVEISSEKTVGLSKVIVYCRLLMRQISHRLSEAVLDSSKIQTLLKTLDEQLHRRFGSIEGNPLYAECTILDPRFKGKGFRDDDNYKKALASLSMRVGAMRTLAAETVPFTTEPTPSTSSSTVPNSIWNDFDTEIARLVPENNTAAGVVEINKYIQEPLINRLDDPLLWWHARKSVYPILYKYVLKRLNIVATSVPCERIFSKAGLTLTNRRRRLKATKVSQLLFIGCNTK